VKEPAGGSVSVSTEGDVAVLRIDDGKANAFSRRKIAAMRAALDASAEAAAVMVCGRPGMLSAGLELAEVRADAMTQRALRKEFMHLMLRLFTYVVPVVVACTGHAIAGGAALLLVADRRIGIDGPYRVGFSEVDTGVALSAAAIELGRYRLPMPFFESMVSGEVFSPARATHAGLLDELADDPVEEARATAARFATLNHAFASTKKLARQHAATSIRSALDSS
jgi:enoyl-CoA hydratase